MTNLLTFDVSVEAEHGAPAPERLISGDPRFTTWNLEEALGGIYAGIWQSTPGKWRVVYDEWEYFNILEGHSILTEDGGAPRHLKRGDRLVLQPGFTGTWEVVETTRKDYVIRL
ncbi:cupin domain-containing protein [Agrobacterium sp. O3.4]|uniref:Cupin domain-containing protein n=1 Tax=Agrobacterium cucumeris TaxID=2862866 RepID=A0ABY8RNE3_9HYPH|nr:MULTISPECIES: cupin domain-containing protein [Rhizobium/Agrobacterium group]MCZ7467701.1 cupin domain-containing protein [Rhizobium rhizogenes]WHO09128.1 cupin domain-containing protein [Agrobacterium cucumeris]